MLRVAIQIKELISSNVTSAIDAATNPAKMLRNLQREIEDAIVSLEREHTLTNRQMDRLKTQLAQTASHEADWSAKAKTAMDHGREDLARQALLAREESRSLVATLQLDIATAQAECDEIATTIAELEGKREDIREKALQQAAADGEHGSAGAPHHASGAADRHRGRISGLEKRTQFAIEDSANLRANASIDHEIEKLRRASDIEAELNGMKQPATARTVGKSAAKKATRKKA